jgi:DNA modification methylase
MNKDFEKTAESLLGYYYRTKRGYTVLGDSLQVLKSLPPDSINLVFTSPPFALTRKKEYGNKEADEYVDWFLVFAKEFYRVMKKDGSFVVDLGGAFLKGIPVRSIYQFELLVRLVREIGFYLAQEFYHYNPARLPAPAEWVNIRRIRVKDSVNVVWWLSKEPFPKANNKKVLKPYSKSMQQLLANGYKPKRRPSGHDISDKFMKENDGAIPPNILELPNTDSNSVYLRKCKQAGVKPHPARFPEKLPEFFIRFLTDEHDIVLDPFAGSNTTGQVAERLNRHWLSIEINEEYLLNSRFRFEEVEFAPVIEASNV